MQKLSQEEIKNLIELHKNGDKSATTRLVNQYKDYVHKVAQSFARKGGLHYLEDLIQQGYLGLIIAFNKFDTSKNVTVLTYADHWIRVTIKNYLWKNQRIVAFSGSKTELSFARAFFKKPTASINEIASDANVSIDKAKPIYDLLSNPEFSLDYSVVGVEGEEKATTLGDSISSGDDIEEKFALQEIAHIRSNQWKESIKNLPAREQVIINYRIKDPDERLTLEEIAHVLNCTKERVRQLEASAVKKLTNALSPIAQ